jgi:hypothetical protein
VWAGWPGLENGALLEKAMNAAPGYVRVEMVPPALCGIFQLLERNGVPPTSLNVSMM